VDGDPRVVVLAQPTAPEGAALERTLEAYGCGLDARAQLGRRGAQVGLGAPLDDDVLVARGVAMLARVVGERHARVALDPLELAREAERGGERDRAGVAVALAERRDRRRDRSPGGVT